nr:MAG TPA: hypothetical protein [Caudoviricetes sp.]
MNSNELDSKFTFSQIIKYRIYAKFIILLIFNFVNKKYPLIKGGV